MKKLELDIEKYMKSFGRWHAEMVALTFVGIEAEDILEHQKEIVEQLEAHGF